MGTNFYARMNTCEQCGRYEEIHLGKSSMGWKFLFKLNKEFYEDKDSFEKFIKGIDVDIYDEYGSRIHVHELLALIDSKQAEKHDHYGKHIKIIGGYDFDETEFS